MPTYVSLLRWTNKGVERIKESPSRLDAARQVFQKAGGTLREFYMVMGRYDMLIVADAPDDATMARALLTIASNGAVQSETLRAFTEDEYRKILSGL